MSYNKTRQMHAGNNITDVQNPGFECLDFGIQSECPILRWSEV